MIPTWRFIRFLIVGSFNTFASYLVYALLIRLGWHFVAANLLAFTVGMLMGFKLHGSLVFDNPGEHRFFHFTLIAVAMLGCSLLIQAMLRSVLNDYISGAISTAISVPISYLLNRRFVFRASANQRGQ